METIGFYPLGEGIHTSFRSTFHCFGGISRCSAALCAWFILWRNLTVEDAVRALLQERPGLRPWKARPYVMWALKTVEDQRVMWIADLRFQ